MKKYIYATGALLVFSVSAMAQGKVKDGTVIGSPSLPNAGSVLELESNNKGLLLPRVSLSSTTVWGLAGTPVTGGMTVYNTNSALSGTIAAPALSGGVGVYYWDGSRWVAGTGQQKVHADSTYWALHGNTGLTSNATTGTAVGSAPFLGTTDGRNLSFGTNSTTRMVIAQNGNAYGGTSSFSNGGESFSWGQRDTASGFTTAAFGMGSRTDALASLVAGRDCKLSNTAVYSAVFGNTNHDSAMHSLMSGTGNTITEQANGSVVFGMQNSIGNTGGLTTSLLAGNMLSGGGNSLDFDGDTNVSGNFACHFNLIAGQSNRVLTSANCAVFGYNNDMNHSDGSMVVGFTNSMETARNSVAMGLLNVDSANQSFVTGQGNIVNPSMSWATVVGRYNVPVSGSLFTVGYGGGAGTRANAFVVTRNTTTGAALDGLIVLIPSLPQYATDAAAAADPSLPAGGLYRTGNDLRIK